ncbi:Hypothetical predicted protein, partial [Paramuricea clavata]
MEQKLARAKGRHLGLDAYLKTLLSELNEYVSSESGDCKLQSAVLLDVSETHITKKPNNPNRFLNNLRKRTKNHGNLITENVLTADEYEQALHMWIKEEQSLIKGQSNFANVWASLNLFEDKDGFLRLKGRFANSNLRYQDQHPMILRGNESYFTQLVIWDAHKASMHHGVESTLAR